MPFGRAVLAVIVLGILSTSVSADESVRRRPASGGSANLSGVWDVKLVPIVDPSGHGSEVTGTLTLLDFGEVLLGHFGGLQLQGTRDGSGLTMDVHFVGPTERDDHGTLELRVIDAGLIKGKGITPIHDDEGDAFEVLDVTLTRQTAADARSLMVVQPNSTASDICSSAVGDLAASFTEDIFVPMDACRPSKAGGGYYVFGRQAPGARDYFTTTMYFPLEVAACTTRKYHFTISSKGQTPIGQLIELISKLHPTHLEKLLLPNVTELIELIRELHDTVGDFAIALGFNTHDLKLEIFVLTPNGSCESVQKTRLYRHIEKNVKKYVPGANNVHINCGRHEIKYYPHLTRSPLLLCNSRLFFVYVLGTLNVEFR